MSKKNNYPFTFPIENDINIHIEHIVGGIACIWFDNNNNEEQNIPNEFKLYNDDEDKIINPFKNTQTYSIPRDGNYKIKYNNKTIIKLLFFILPSIPPIYKNEIKIIYSNNDDIDYSDDDI